MPEQVNSETTVKVQTNNVIDPTKNILDKDKSIIQISSNLKSSRFILAVLVIIPSMTCFGYALTALTDAKDKLIVVGMINTIISMIMVFYFSDKLQQNKTDGN